MARGRGQRDERGITLGGASRARARDEAIANGREVMDRAVSTEDQTERMLLMVDAVQTALEDTNLRPAVVGGLVVEYFTGDYTTGDIDVLLPSSDVVKERLSALGFQQVKEGRIWTHPHARVEWEMPGAALDAVDQAGEVEVPGGRRILMLRCEDMLVHRIEEFVGQGNADVYEQTMALFGYEGLDLGRVRERAAASNHDHAIDVLLEHYERLQTPGAKFPAPFELHELADALAVELIRKNGQRS